MDTEEPKKNQGGRPRKDITKTAEFQDAVAAAVSAATQDIVTRLAGLRMDSGVQASDGDHDMISKLALSIGEIANQTSGRVIVAPQELERRAKGRSRMISILQRVHDHGLIPEYKLTSETYLNDALIKPFENDATGAIKQVEIEWDGIPNEAMVPANEIAEEIYDAFVQSIGGFTDAAKGAKNEPYWVTKNGLTIKGRGGSRRTVGSLGDSHRPNVPDAPAPTFASRFSKKGNPNDPTAAKVNVLGTIASPAAQNAHGVGVGR